MAFEQEVRGIIEDAVAELGRPDLFRTPVVAYSNANDGRYRQLKTQVGEWCRTPQELLPEARTVINYFVPFTRAVVKDPRTAEDEPLLWTEAYCLINSYFDTINQAVADYLESQGFVVATAPTACACADGPDSSGDPDGTKAPWSHRNSAVIAGLATLGASRIPITEKGSGGRFCSIITTAKMMPNVRPLEEMCFNKQNGSCGRCFQACPANALTRYSTNEPACREELAKNMAKLQAEHGITGADVCGKCISVCPLAYME